MIVDMTLILGINLTDSVYLAADTRVTRMRNGEIVDTHDDLLKIWGNQDGIFCAVAGDAGLAKHLLNELRYHSFARRGIEELRAAIEQFVYDNADAYWQEKGATTEATLMFAGSSKRRKARIDTDLIKRLVDAHLANKEARSELGGRKFMMYSDIMNLPTEQFKTNIYATDLFAVQISDRGVIITDTKPGEHLAYGSPGLVKEDVEFKEVARLEFGSDETNPMMLTAYINMMRENRNLQGVGSVVVPIRIQPDGKSILVTGTTYTVRVNDDGVPIPEEVSSIAVDAKTGTFYRVQNGNKIELTPIGKYDTPDSDSLSLLCL